MSDTPRTNAELLKAARGMIEHDGVGIMTDFARTLERELGEAKAKLESYSDDCAMMDSLREELNQLRADLAEVANILPATFYADLPLQDRFTFMYEHWRKCVVVNQESELANDQLRAEVERLKASEYQMALAKRVVRVHELTVERDQWRAVAEQAITLLGANHTSSCSIQDPEEPRCDCGYQQHYELALAAYEKLKGESK